MGCCLNFSNILSNYLCLKKVFSFVVIFSKIKTVHSFFYSAALKLSEVNDSPISYTAMNFKVSLTPVSISIDSLPPMYANRV